MAEEATSSGSRQIEARGGPEREEIRDRLNNVQSALDEIEQQVQQDSEALERLREVFDTSYLEQIMQMVNELELRINEVAKEANRARERAEEAESELRAEQERLEKLWDVYKKQERELEDLEEERDQAQRELEETEGRVHELEDELASEREALRQAQKENGRLREKLQARDAELEDMQAQGDLEDRVEELEQELEEERERLAKLYGVFEETEAERDDLAAEVRQWSAWFDAHEDALRGVAEAVNEVPESD